MNSHDPRHDEWLIAILAGDEVSREARLATESCAECRSALSEVGRIGDVLDLAGRLERESIDRAFPSAEARKPSGLRVDVHPSGRERRWFASPLQRVAAAALVLVTIGLCYRQVRNSDRPFTVSSGPNLNASQQFQLVPSGTVAAVTQFSFEAPRPSGGTFQVRVYDPAAGATPILESPPLEEPRWIPDPDQLGKLPSRFRWELRVLDATGLRISTASAEVEVRSN